MTCIAAFINRNKSITMGGDSAGVANYSRTIRRDPKVFIKKGMIFGFCGSFRMGQLIQFELQIPVHKPGMDTFKYMGTAFITSLRKCLKDGGFSVIENNEESGGTFLVGYRGRLFMIDADFQVGESILPYNACGSGEDLALGSLFTSTESSDKLKIKKALEAATFFNSGVAPPFTILKLPYRK